jgi:hypothetical protein
MESWKQNKSGNFRSARIVSKIDAMLKDAKIDGELMSSLEIVSKILNQLLKVLLQLLNQWLH